MNNIKLFLSFCAIGLAACSESSVGNVTRPFADTMNISGRIDHDFVEELKRASSSIEAVKINSQGGSTEAAMEMGKIIRDRNYKLIISKYCLSACAQWILPAARNVQIETGALVAMHQTATWSSNLLEKIDPKLVHVDGRRLREVELKYYEQIGVDSNLLLYPYGFKEPICFLAGETHSGASIDDTSIIVSKWEVTVLSIESYKKLTGQEIVGRWPHTREEILRALKYNIPSEVKLTVIQERKDDGTIRPQEFPQLDKCDPAIRASIKIS